MRTPAEVAEVAEIIRKLSRSTGKVRTGLGAGRQDVNVSINGGVRIEIKGVSRIGQIPLLTYNEAMRQWNLLKIKNELSKRGITSENLETKSGEVTKYIRKTRYQPINLAVQEGKKVYAVLLRGFKGLLIRKTQTDTYFSKEFSDRVRVIACLTTLPNIIHSDSPTENLSTLEWQSIRKFLGGNDDDTIVLVWGLESDAITGVSEIQIRAREAALGIPSETRQALIDGTNGFERILPGPERMYPDTDLPPKQITKERIERIKNNLPELYWIAEERYSGLGLRPHQIRELSVSKYSSVFEKLVFKNKINPVFAAEILIDYFKSLERKGYNPGSLEDEDIYFLFDEFSKGRITKKGVFISIDNYLSQKISIEEALPKKISEYDDINQILNKEYKFLLSGKLFSKRNLPTLLIGRMMNYYNGRIEGKEIMKKVYDFLKEYDYDIK